jgi:SH3-like domain-containing protein
MPSNLMNRIYAISIFIFFQCITTLYAQEPFPFKGNVKADNINVRTDSTASSEVICSLNKDTDVEVILELYDWYKIKLPSNAPAFIKKDFATMIDDKTAKVSGDNINKGDWYRIEPVSSSFGWIHKGYVKRQEAKLAQKSEKEEEDTIIVEGIIKPKTIKHIATHKLITSDNKVLLLRGDKNSLVALSHRKVRITGKLSKPAQQEYPIIDITKIEVLD